MNVMIPGDKLGPGKQGRGCDVVRPQFKALVSITTQMSSAFLFDILQ